MHGSRASFKTPAEMRAWYAGWLVDAALPFWATVGFDAPAGGFHEQVAQAGPDAAAPRRARVQSRQIWVYATAATLGLGVPRLDLAWAAYGAFVRRYRQPEGLFATAIGADGALIHGKPRLYEQAFALLAMAALHRADPAVAAPLNDARALRANIERFRHRSRGFQEQAPQPYQSNAQMHLLEAALAWEEAGEPDWADLADEIVGLALDCFIDGDGGFLREFFDEAWRPAAGNDGRWVEPGHQFEWAWLLDRWARLRGDAAAREASRRLYEAGLAGVDRGRGVAVNILWDDLSVRDPAARLWPQTEYLKASVALGVEEEASVAAQGLRTYLDAPCRGAWRDVQDADGGFAITPSPASSFYHIAGACFRLLRP
jgi:mannose-6-phosphate isomerase